MSPGGIPLGRSTLALVMPVETGGIKATEVSVMCFSVGKTEKMSLPMEQKDQK